MRIPCRIGSSVPADLLQRTPGWHCPLRFRSPNRSESGDPYNNQICRRHRSLSARRLHRSRLFSCCVPTFQAGCSQYQRNSSHSFRSEQTFFRATPTAASMTGFALRALWGHTEMQRIQDIHALSSTFFGSSLSIA